MSQEAANQGPWTVARLLAWTRAYFERNGLESARLCAEALLAHAMNCERIQLYTRFEAEPDPQTLAAFRDSVKQAAAGRPIAYLTGVKEFFSLPFNVTPDVLTPRPETEVLVERVIHLVRAQPGEIRRVLEIGVGSGCIVVSLARHLPGVALSASDISAPALEVARGNAARHGVESRIELREGDLFEPWMTAGPFDLIVSNPPYIGLREASELSPGVRDHEPHLALFSGEDGLRMIQRLLDESPARLARQGHLLLEVAFNQAPAVRERMNQAGWRDIVTYRDDLGHERVAHARAPRRD